MIKIVPYNPLWPEFFDIESTHIKEILNENFIDIHHIGSTSVPGLAAKNIIDIIIIVKNNRQNIATLEENEYIFKGEYNIPMRYFFNKRGEVDFNIHLYENNHPEIELNLIFRNYLRKHVEARDDYAKLKENLIRIESSQLKSNSSFSNYTLGKGNFIRNILNKTGFKRLRILKCSDDYEWESCSYYRGLYFSNHNIISDPEQWTLSHHDHSHLVLYKGCKIIGYCHIHFQLNKYAIIKLIIKDKDSQERNLENEFRSLIQIWLNSLLIKLIDSESSH